MAQRDAQAQAASGTAKGDVSEEFSSNAVRLSLGEWAIALALLVAVMLFLPWIVQRRQTFEPSADYRHPYQYGEDYWLYARYSRYAHSHCPVAVIGDSVVWGHYVTPEGTLTHFLNQEANEEDRLKPVLRQPGLRFANLGLDGTRPMALAGLIEYYCRDIAGQGVILHLNPLWMSSDEADLHQRDAGLLVLRSKLLRRVARARGHKDGEGSEGEKEGVRINHARLVPQTAHRPYGYQPSFDAAVGIAAERYLPYAAWVRHLRMVYFDNLGIESWSLENPYRNPLGAISSELPQPEDRPEGDPVPWTRSGVERQDFPWVPLEQSYQWERFRRAVDLLQARGNHVFVLVGPMNTHLMTEASRRRYDQLQGEMEAWLKAHAIAYSAPPALPSELYADSSHPLKAGYARLAKELYGDGSFREWVAAVGGRPTWRRPREVGGDEGGR